MPVSFSTSELMRVDESVWEIPASARSGMRVPVRVFADEELLAAILADRSLEQLENVATLPGIVDAALAMPDIHQGYGFPVGGVAATETPDGVVSPGGVGYDINCGVRLLALPVTADELGRRVEPLVHELSRAIPAGPGSTACFGSTTLRSPACSVEGPRVLVEELGIGTDEDVERTESKAASRAPTRPRCPRVRGSAASASSARSDPATISSRCSGSTASSTRSLPRRSDSARDRRPCSSTPARAGSATRSARTTCG